MHVTGKQTNTCALSNLDQVFPIHVTFKHSLREKYPYWEFFWSAFFHIWNEYRKVRMRKNTDQNTHIRLLMKTKPFIAQKSTLFH